MAVIVEGGGYGSRSAAPIAAALVLKAKDLGYFNGIANQRPTALNAANQPRQQRHRHVKPDTAC